MLACHANATAGSTYSPYAAFKLTDTPTRSTAAAGCNTSAMTAVSWFILACYPTITTTAGTATTTTTSNTSVTTDTTTTTATTIATTVTTTTVTTTTVTTTTTTATTTATTTTTTSTTRQWHVQKLPGMAGECGREPHQTTTPSVGRGAENMYT